MIVSALACAAMEPLQSCADSLAGVWRGQGQAPSGDIWQYHILDRGDALEVYPMFDDRPTPEPSQSNPSQSNPSQSDSWRSETSYSPAFFTLTRRGRTIAGKRTYRVERGGITCAITHQAAIRSCAQGRLDRARLDLAWVATAHIEWPGCTAVSSTTWTSRTLTRQPGPTLTKSK